MDTLCGRCQELRFADLFHVDIAILQRRYQEPIGTLADLTERSKQCRICRYLLHYVEISMEGTWPSDPGNTDCALFIESSWRSHLSFCGFEDMYRVGVETQAVRSAIPFTGRRASCISVEFTRYHVEDGVNMAAPGDRKIRPLHRASVAGLEQQYCARERLQDRVDFGLARIWLQLCMEKHGERCAHPAYNALPPPENIRLLDVQNHAVVAAPPDPTYVALSYVWGGPQLVAAANDLTALPWRLPSLDSMAKTVRHAMVVSAELGMRYLWVDALCIQQEPQSNPDKAYQLAQMDRIYSHAALVVMASDCTSATSGIPGVEQRNVREDTIEVDGLKLAMSSPTLEQDIARGIWNTRGWTYQERMLAKRALILGRHQAYWLCQRDAWCESTVAEPPTSSEPFEPPPEQEDSGPPRRPVSLSLTAYNMYDEDGLSAIGGYINIVQQYTIRKLGYPSDGFNAIAGVLNILGQTHPSSFRVMYQGLPEACFDLAMLWRPKGRYARSDLGDAQPRPPSWTWAGWFSGDGQGVEWDFGLYWSGRPWLCGGVNWYLVDDLGDSHPIARRDRQIAAYTLSAPPIPCGLPDDNSQSHPPVISPTIDLAGFRYLHFLTTACDTFRIGTQGSWYGARSEGVGHPSVNPYEIVSTDGVCCGTIILSFDDAHQLHTSERILDLIFISYASNFEFTIKDALCPTGEWPVANVMWVQRLANGTVERLQLARVSVDAWIATGPKSEWILLG